MNKANKNNKAKYICLLCTQPYEESPSENSIQCVNVCCDVTIAVRIMLAKDFLGAIFVVFTFFDSTISVSKNVFI